jgi:hypothetical protein
MSDTTTEADQSPAHTLHVVGAYDGGVNFRLDCDDPAVCIARSHGDGCALQSWWDEDPGELIDRDGLVGPPPWRVYPRWDDDEPTVAQIGWVRCEGSGQPPVGRMRPERREAVCRVCGRTVLSFSTLARHNRPISVDSVDEAVSA